MSAPGEHLKVRQADQPFKDEPADQDGSAKRMVAKVEPAVTGFHPVIPVGKTWNVLDLSKGYHPESISLDPPSIGRYNEKRTNMYTTGLFGGVRNIHMGLDIWVPEGTPVRAFSDCRVLFFRDNDNPGDYGPTIITEHKIGSKFAIYTHYDHYAQGAGRTNRDGRADRADISASGKGTDSGQSEEITLYALYGHLSRASLDNVTEGKPLSKGQIFAEVGGPQVNGGWVPHLHFQLSWERPAEPDMPGVVAEEDHLRALQIYPDPRLVLGNLY